MMQRRDRRHEASVIRSGIWERAVREGAKADPIHELHHGQLEVFNEAGRGPFEDVS